jgi:hypothetical protein
MARGFGKLPPQAGRIKAMQLGGGKGFQGVHHQKGRTAFFEPFMRGPIETSLRSVIGTRAAKK